MSLRPKKSKPKKKIIDYAPTMRTASNRRLRRIRKHHSTMLSEAEPKSKRHAWISAVLKACNHEMKLRGLIK